MVMVRNLFILCLMTTTDGYSGCAVPGCKCCYNLCATINVLVMTITDMTLIRV